MSNDAQVKEGSWYVQIDPPESEVNALRHQLLLDNGAKVEHHDDEIAMAIFLRDEDKDLLAGISGYLWGATLEIHCLWVSERLRDQGIGSRLVLAIEQEAAERGGSTAITNTYSFQAPEFYAKLGYETFGIIPGFGNRFQKYFLRKTL